MESVDYLLKAGWVLTMDDDAEPLEEGAVAVKGNRIVDVGRAAEIEGRYVAADVIHEPRAVIMPGLINTHTHAPMVYFRGMADDLPLKEWLEGHVWPAEAQWLGHEFVRDATELACLEMVKAGVTTYNDMYFFGAASAESVHRIGMRAVLGAGIVDFPSMVAKTPDEYISNAEAFIRDFRDDELVVPCVAPHAPYSCNADSYRRASGLAERYDVPVHTHISEAQWEVGEIEKRYGKSPVEYLDSLGVLNERMIAAHCVWISEKEIRVLAERRVSVAHCPESNLKLASGIAPVVTMLDVGVNVAFGTDGAASNNDLNILSEMATAAKLHKAVSGDPTVLDARTAVRMATRRGAEALGLGRKIGCLKRGFLADIVLIDLHKPHLVPLYDVYSHLVYAANAADVRHVMINGAMIVRDRKPVRCSEEEILETALRWAEKVVARRSGQAGPL